jgi:SAM-dependent methyltransferase
VSEDPGERWRRVARLTQGEDYPRRYAARFDALAASGVDPHGEAALVARLVPPGSRVLDAGCGTGRVAVRLHELGYVVVGVDFDEAMVAVARERAPELAWHVADLAALDLGTTFDLVVAAGNVVPLAGAAALPAIAGRLAQHLAPGGLLVAGFGVDAAHLPPGGVPVLPLAAYDAACAAAGLRLRSRYADWQGTAYDGGGYAVSVHERSGPAAHGPTGDPS